MNRTNQRTPDLLEIAVLLGWTEVLLASSTAKQTPSASHVRPGDLAGLIDAYDYGDGYPR